jgi:hypothetical protein
MKMWLAQADDAVEEYFPAIFNPSLTLGRRAAKRCCSAKKFPFLQLPGIDPARRVA